MVLVDSYGQLLKNLQTLDNISFRVSRFIDYTATSNTL